MTTPSQASPKGKPTPTDETPAKGASTPAQKAGPAKGPNAAKGAGQGQGQKQGQGAGQRQGQGQGQGQGQRQGQRQGQGGGQGQGQGRQNLDQKRGQGQGQGGGNPANQGAKAGPNAKPDTGPNAAPKQPQPAPAPNTAPAPNAAPAGPARMRGRHWGIIFSFLLHVLVPIGVTGWYLYDRAADQYASTVGFSVRREEGTSGVELLAGLSAVGSSSSSDADILYEFIQSQKLVADINARIDLAAMWSIPYETDPYFGYDPDGTIEDLLAHWDRKVRIFYDSGTGLIEVRVLAFRAQDAHAIAQAIYDESSVMINTLSDIARNDAISYARAELERAEERLAEARGAVTDYRNRNQIVDPSADLQNQAGLLGNLQAQLAEALIEVDLLTETTQPGDPRIEQSQLRVRVIRDRIAEERSKMGIGDEAEGGVAFADLVGEFERLSVEREFAESAYIATLASFDAAQAEARRQTRYLAAHVQPTMAERALFPQRFMLLALVAMFILIIWSILVLVYYSLKDRR